MCLFNSHALQAAERSTLDLHISAESAPAAPSDVAFVRQALAARGGSAISHNFLRTVHAHDAFQRPQVGQLRVCSGSSERLPPWHCMVTVRATGGMLEGGLFTCKQQTRPNLQS